MLTSYSTMFYSNLDLFYSLNHQKVSTLYLISPMASRETYISYPICTPKRLIPSLTHQVCWGMVLRIDVSIIMKDDSALAIGLSGVLVLPCSQANIVAAINGAIFSSSCLFTFLTEWVTLGFRKFCILDPKVTN